MGALFKVDIWRRIINKILLFFLSLFSVVSIALIKALRTLVSSYWLFPLSCIIGYVTLFFIIPLYIQPLDEKIIETLCNLLGIDYLQNTLNPKLFTASRTFIGTLIPVSLTLYFFAYRAQQATSTRNLLIRNAWFLVFIFSSLLTVVYGSHLGNLVNKVFVENAPIESWKMLSTRAKVYFNLLFVSLISVLPMIQSLLRSTNIRAILDDMLSLFKVTMIFIALIPLKSQQKMLFSDLNVYVEAIYQLLNFSINNNMNEVYEKKYENWQRELSEFQQKSIPIFGNKSFSEILFERDELEFSILYRTILRNHSSFIMTLVKNNRLDEYEHAINSFFELKPHFIGAKPIYISALHELVTVIYDDKTASLRPILNGLENRFLGDKDAIIIYKWLIMKTIQENDVKNLTIIVYSILKSIQKLKSASVPVKTKSNYANRMKSKIQRNEFNRKNLESLNEIKLMFTVFFLEGAIKSIELAHYGCTGFIIKFIVTNIESEILSRAYVIMSDNYIADELEYKEETTSKVLFNINGSTFDYCYKKLSILLYSQQRYVINHKLKLVFSPEIYINISTLKGCEWIEYLLKKLDKAKTKYGLIYLEDDKFMKSIKEEIYHKSML